MSETAPSTEKLEFKAEVAAVLKLVTNSLYTNREIFLRELISNASDALDKARFEALVDDTLSGKDLELKIRITADARRGVLIVEDVGIGMTREEATKNLGTIAHSGTLQFLEQAAADRAEGKKADLGLIGKFGVGFYSSLMVADAIEVHSMSARPGNDAVLWSTTGDGGFTIANGVREQRGTRIELKLQDDAKEFLERYRLEQIVRRYSNYVLYPIEIEIRDDKGEVVGEAGQVNAAKAFWTQSASSLTDDDYKEFYKHVMGGFVLPGDEPLGRVHLSMDAPIQFKAVLYVPGKRPTDLLGEDARALQLYARRVLVMESCDKLLPNYLRFFRGVVDSEDLPLNVSRESLQDHTCLAAIRRQLTRKALKLLEDTASDKAEDYGKLWEEFGVFLKEGLHTDNGHRDQLTKLLRFKSTGDGGVAWISLAEYVASMPEDQPALYYITGESGEALAQSPHLEACRARGWPVLLMTDAVDEWVVQDLNEFEGKALRSVTQGDLDVSDNDPKDDTEDDAKDKPSNPDDDKIAALLGAAREILADKVKDVRASKRLTDSAACLVDVEGGLSRNMERILRMANREAPARPRVLELNADHAFVQAAQTVADGDPKSARLTTWVQLLLDQANLAEGEVVDPPGLVRRIQAVLDAAAGVGEAGS